MFTCAGAAEETECMARRILRILELRHAVHIGELRMRLGVNGAAVQAELNAMMARGEVERLRPADYPQEDHDFFRATPPASGSRNEDMGRTAQAAKDAQHHVRLAGEAMVFLVN